MSGKQAPEDRVLVAFNEFAAREMPWLTEKARDDSERLLRTTAVTAFRRGYETGLQPELLREIQHVVFYHDQLTPADVARLKAALAKQTGEGA